MDEAGRHGPYAYTPESLAERWDVSAATVRTLVREGRLRAFRVGRQIRIRPEWVEEFERAQAEPGPQAEPAPDRPRLVVKPLP
jgi:excisionase family DNA binding protein